MIPHYVYGIYWGKRLIYIGMTVNPVNRCMAHMSSSWTTPCDFARTSVVMYFCIHHYLGMGIVPRIKIIYAAKSYDDALSMESELVYKSKFTLFNIQHAYNPTDIYASGIDFDFDYHKYANIKIRKSLKFQLELCKTKKRIAAKATKALRESLEGKQSPIKRNQLRYTLNNPV